MSDIHLSGIEHLNELANTPEGSLSIAKSYVNHLNVGNNSNPWVIYENDINKLADKIYKNRGKPLSGLIIGVKDVIATEEFETLMGSGEVWKNQNMGFDARIVSNFKMSGAVIGGKTKTSEFAVHKETDVVNPNFPGMTAGTSSAGSAAAVANKSVKIALGTQTAGSIARPASYCNVLAMKPTYGLMPRTGVLKTCDQFDTLGLFSDSVEALSLSLEAVRIRGNNYPVISDLDDEGNFRFTKIMILAGKDFDKAQDDVREQISEIGVRISNQLGLAIFTPSSKELEIENIRKLHEEIYKEELRYYLQEEHNSNLLSAKLINFLGDELIMSSEGHRNNLKALTRWRKKFSEVVDDALILSVAANQGAPKKDATYDFDMNLVITAAGLPQVIIPNLLQTEDNKFIGLSVSGDRFSDNSILNLINKL